MAEAAELPLKLTREGRDEALEMGKSLAKAAQESARLEKSIRDLASSETKLGQISDATLRRRVQGLREARREAEKAAAAERSGATRGGGFGRGASAVGLGNIQAQLINELRQVVMSGLIEPLRQWEQDIRELGPQSQDASGGSLGRSVAAQARLDTDAFIDKEDFEGLLNVVNSLARAKDIEFTGVEEIDRKAIKNLLILLDTFNDLGVGAADAAEAARKIQAQTGRTFFESLAAVGEASRGKPGQPGARGVDDLVERGKGADIAGRELEILAGRVAATNQELSSFQSFLLGLSDAHPGGRLGFGQGALDLIGAGDAREITNAVKDLTASIDALKAISSTRVSSPEAEALAASAKAHEAAVKAIEEQLKSNQATREGTSEREDRIQEFVDALTRWSKADPEGAKGLKTADAAKLFGLTEAEVNAAITRRRTPGNLARTTQ